MAGFRKASPAISACSVPRLEQGVVGLSETKLVGAHPIILPGFVFAESASP